METQAHYNLNTAIENWRNELAAQPNLTSDDRRELETHLRDAIAEFRQRGLNDEESFWLARRRVGQPSQLSEEFVKANPGKIWRERVFWMVLAALVLTLAASSVDEACSFFTALVFKNSFNIGGEELFTGCFRLFFYWLPVTSGVMLLSSGRCKFNFPKLVSFFRSRFRVCMAAFLWVLINIGLHAWLVWPVFQGLKHNLAKTPAFNYMTPYTFWVALGNSLLPMAVWPLLLITVLIWLMPPQNQKTPKHA